MSLLGIFLIIIAVFVIYYILKYAFGDPYTLNKMTTGQTEVTVQPADLAGGGTSLNFAYSIWVYVNDWNYNFGEIKPVYGRVAKGTAQGQSLPGYISPCPMVVLGETQNNVRVLMECEGGSTSATSLDNIPLQKWVNVLVSVYGRTMDVYLDGKLVKTTLLPGVPNVDPNANVYITPGGGFDGWTSNFQYYPNALNPQDVWNIYAKGYGGNILSNFLRSFQIQVNLLQNGVQYSSFTV